MTTIFSFPVELLAEIFNIAVQRPVSCPRPKAILAISQVCRHWRTVCLETPQFWSGIVVYGCNRCNRYATIFLERCKGTPIDLYAGTNMHQIGHTKFPQSDMGSDVSSLITPHTDQIRSITILGECPLLEFVTSLKQPLPLLRSVRMNAISLETLLWELPVGDQAVTIHTLDLMGIAIPLDLPIFRDMVHFSICLGLIQDPPTIESLLAILASSPRMRVLRFDHSGPPTSQQLLLPPSQIVRLEHLEHLDLRASIHDVAYLFSHVSIPLTTVIKIEVVLERISYLSSLFFPESILTKLLSTSSFLFLSFKSLGYFQNYQFQGVEFGCTVYGGRDGSVSAPLKYLHDMFNLVPTPSPLSDIELCLDGMSVTDHEWVGIITCPAICHVRSLLAYSVHQSFFVALASQKPPETPYLPYLETLSIFPQRSEANVAKKYIQNYLEGRISAGIRLKELRVPEWFAELPQCKALLSLVDSFVTLDDFHCPPMYH